MAKVMVSPETFEYVEFDVGTIQDLAEEVSRLVGMPDDVEVDLQIDEAVMMANVELEIENRRVILKVTGGAFEDLRKLRQFAPSRARTVLATYLMRARDRLDPGFADAPPNSELNVQQTSAWDTYTEGRMARASLPTRRPRRLYHFRLRHGFSDEIDAVFERLWHADALSWADLQAACDETARLKAAL